MVGVGRALWGGGIVLAGLSLAVYAGVASRDARPTSPPTAAPPTLMYGWEQKFKIEWSVESAGGARRLRGYITSQHGELAEPLRLLVQGVDASGSPQGRRIWAIPGGVNGFQRAYFEIPDLPSAHTYRVSIWDYSLRQSWRRPLKLQSVG